MDKLNTKELVEKYNFKFTKSLGQNFLTDYTVLEDIVDGANITVQLFRGGSNSIHDSLHITLNGSYGSL